MEVSDKKVGTAPSPAELDNAVQTICDAIHQIKLFASLSDYGEDRELMDNMGKLAYKLPMFKEMYDNNVGKCDKKGSLDPLQSISEDEIG